MTFVKCLPNMPTASMFYLYTQYTIYTIVIAWGLQSQLELCRAYTPCAMATLLLQQQCGRLSLVLWVQCTVQYAFMTHLFETEHAQWKQHQHLVLVRVVDRPSENARFVELVDHPKRFETNIGQFFMTFDHLVAQSTLSNAYFLRFGKFCAHDDDNNDDRTDYFTPCACSWGNNLAGVLITAVIVLELCNQYSCQSLRQILYD